MTPKPKNAPQSAAQPPTLRRGPARAERDAQRDAGAFSRATGHDEPQTHHVTYARHALRELADAYYAARRATREDSR